MTFPVWYLRKVKWFHLDAPEWTGFVLFQKHAEEVNMFCRPTRTRPPGTEQRLWSDCDIVATVGNYTWSRDEHWPEEDLSCTQSLEKEQNENHHTPSEFSPFSPVTPPSVISWKDKKSIWIAQTSVIVKPATHITSASFSFCHWPGLSLGVCEIQEAAVFTVCLLWGRTTCSFSFSNMINQTPPLGEFVHSSQRCCYLLSSFCSPHQSLYAPHIPGLTSRILQKVPLYKLHWKFHSVMLLSNCILEIYSSYFLDSVEVNMFFGMREVRAGPCTEEALTGKKTSMLERNFTIKL